MYRVILVDDEAAAVEYIQGIIETRCSGFEVVGTARSGDECLDVWKHTGADVIITDIRMAGIGGIELIEKIREINARIQLIIVSGFSEFEYAKKAITNKVFEYVLKPVDPEEFRLIMKRLSQMLESFALEEKSQLLKMICHGDSVEMQAVKKYFGDEKYFAFLLRKNHLPERFPDNRKTEVISNIYGSYFLYARDEDEAFYLIPKNCLNSEKELRQIIDNCCDKFRQERGFLTVVEATRAFDSDKMVSVIGDMYSMLQQNIICGVSQNLNIMEREAPVGINAEERDRMQKLLFFLGKGQNVKAKAELKMLCMDFQQRQVAQTAVHNMVRQICSYENFGSVYLVNEILHQSFSMEELYENLSGFLFGKKEMENGKLDTLEYFEGICNFVEKHLDKPISLNSVVNEFHVSQSHLSYIFRKYADQSFNTYLTAKRIEKAKEILANDADILIKDVAQMVGFRDQFYFSRVFKMYTGVRPTDYERGKE